MIEYRMITLRLSKAVLKINNLIVPNMFDGWINTKEHILEVDFNAQGYNYGFDFEWRCTSDNTSIIDELKFDQTLIVLSSFKNTDPFMDNYNDLYPFQISWSRGRPQINEYQMLFGTEESNERYINRNNRASSFDSCLFNIKNEIFMTGGGRNPYQISKMDGREFIYLSRKLPIPAYFALCSQPSTQNVIICGKNGKKSCFMFDGNNFDEVSADSNQAHSNAVATYFGQAMVIISVHSIESLSISVNNVSEWRDFTRIVGLNMIRFGSAVSLESQILLFGGQLTDLSYSDLVHRYRDGEWSQIQRMTKPRSIMNSILVTDTTILHISMEYGELDSIERWIYDDESGSFFVEDFASFKIRSEIGSIDNTMIYSKPLITNIQDYENAWSFWSEWSKHTKEGEYIFSRIRCKGVTTDCSTQIKNMTDTKSLLIIGSGSNVQISKTILNIHIGILRYKCLIYNRI